MALASKQDAAENRGAFQHQVNHHVRPMRLGHEDRVHQRVRQDLRMDVRPTDASSFRMSVAPPAPHTKVRMCLVTLCGSPRL